MKDKSKQMKSTQKTRKQNIFEDIRAKSILRIERRNMTKEYKEVIQQLASEVYEQCRHIFEPEHYVELQQLLDEKGQDWIAKVLEYITIDQARLFWYMKGAPLQDEKGRKDDYFNAKRYVGYLLADKIIVACRIHHICPNVFLKPEFVPYLSCVTVHEYVQYKAYFRALAEQRNQKSSTTRVRDEDYYKELNVLRESMAQCKHETVSPSYWDTILEHWRDLLQVAINRMSPDLIDRIIRAKQNSLARLSRNVHEQQSKVDQFVRDFYDGMFNYISGKRIISKATTQKAVERILNGTDKNTYVVTVFEFMLRCPLICSVLPSTTEK